MRVILKGKLIAIGVDDSRDTAEADADLLRSFAELSDGHVYQLRAKDQTLVLHDLGPKEFACRLPINVHFRSGTPGVRLISNLARTPFFFDGAHYQSVEGFWQGLKFPDPKKRLEMAELYGLGAKRAGEPAEPTGDFLYGGRTVQAGSPEHWRLMREACRAKFLQNAEARDALLATGERQLVHRMKRDSVTIPGAIMADIWTRIRAELQSLRAKSAWPDAAANDETS